MTRDDIIRMMREAGFTVQRDEQLFTGIFERFAALVAAAEREACAKVCEHQMTGINPVGDIAREDCADAIRARSNNETDA
jgi:hypothetical protein